MNSTPVFSHGGENVAARNVATIVTFCKSPREPRRLEKGQNNLESAVTFPDDNVRPLDELFSAFSLNEGKKEVSEHSEECPGVSALVFPPPSVRDVVPTAAASGVCLSVCPASILASV